MNKARANKSELKIEMLFILPALALYTIFFIIPFVTGIYYSFTDWRGIDGLASFIGVRNYVTLIRDNFFIDSVKRTFYFTIINVSMTNILAMLFALMLATKTKINNLYRLIISLPNIISMIATGFLWQFMFTKISASLYDATALKLFDVNWLSNEKIILISIVIVTLWQGLGYIMIIYIAGIQSVDSDIIEAASMDGANAIESFIHIQLPAMMPTLLVGVFLNVAGSLKIFDVVFSLTGGGPGRITEVMVLNIYNEAFVNNRLGYANAKALILTCIVILVTSIQMVYMNKAGDN